MVLFDSSALIDYLDGDESVVTFVSTYAEGLAITLPLVAFEVYQGEIYRLGETDLSALDDALRWLQVIQSDRSDAR